MNSIVTFFMQPASADSVSYALVFLRVSIGVIMVFHGLPKIVGGIPVWRELGTAMAYLGIHFLPVIWGLACALTEFFGGVSLILGLGVRISCILLLCAMAVALTMHLSKQDRYSEYSHALTLIVIFTTFLIIGSGNFSLDNYFLR